MAKNLIAKAAMVAGGVLALGGCSPGPRFHQEIRVDGRELALFGVQRSPVGQIAVYVPPGDHPTTADLTAGMVYSHLPVQQLVRQIAKGNDQSARRVYARVPFDTKDAVRFQNCRVYADDIGQPAMSLEVAERVSSNTSVGTTIVRELDNLEQAQKGWELCKEAQDRLGEVWVLHRSMFPANN